ncbi:S8 family peptidase [Aspergillus homomorphus CBS 101889]|uniref:Subtilisin-like protein n=1 Tax=Aspergillus homomorphus (strain CBS 101889) TaxID=1450537 RepID=A0A395HIT9_ASPHC|nr:subtilisin-like protein [Aspergillus homomorphus CBS 101889]RAL07353.1 subtilisin-like protein [Aspergillus homomorphus CBS 101889]
MGCTHHCTRTRSIHLKRVDYVEPNQYFHIQDNVEQPNLPSWGLSRVSHRGPHNSGNNKYTYDENESGQGVTAYVVDTGIKINHNGIAIPSGASDTDNQGHGTHVAGTIAGTKYGVAKKATVVAVKVFPDNSGSTDTSTIIRGIEWAPWRRNRPALDSAVDAAVQAGMVVAVAAGNRGEDAHHSSPARSPNALTTGAIDQTDTMPPWSNWGQILDFNAPGVNIVSCGISSTDAEATLSGTSMASPHIAGLASCLRQNPKYSNFHRLAYELRLRAEGGCKPYTGHEAGTPNLAAVNKTAY